MIGGLVGDGSILLGKVQVRPDEEARETARKRTSIYLGFCNSRSR